MSREKISKRQERRERMQRETQRKRLMWIGLITLGAALMGAAEAFAREAGRTLLVLDTASPDAERLYARMGWQSCGVIPRYALLPNGEPCATRFFYRDLDSS